MNTRRAIAQTLASQAVSLVAMAIAMTVLARLLSPQDFGIFAISVALFAVGKTLANFGLEQALVRAPSVATDEIAGAAGFSLILTAGIVGAALATIAALHGGVLTSEAALVHAIVLASLLTLPLMLPIRVALMRRIHFGLLSIVATVRVVTDAALAIALALAGAGAPALAVGYAASHVASYALLAICCPREARLLPRLGAARGHRALGLRIVATGLIPRLGELGLVSAINAILGAATLGLYNRAQMVNQLFDRAVLEAVNPTILPGISRSLEAGVEAKRIYLLKVDYLAAICWPSFAFIAVFAEPIVALLLGAQWDAAVRPVQILALGGLALPITQMSFKLFVALDLTAQYLRIVAAHHLARTTLACGAAFISLEAVCAAVAVTALAKAAVVTLRVKRATLYSSRALLASLARAAAAAGGMLAAPLLLLAFVPARSAIEELALAVPAAGLGWLAALLLTRHPILAELLTAARKAQALGQSVLDRGTAGWNQEASRDARPNRKG